MKKPKAEAQPLQFGALKGRHAGKIGYYDDDEDDRAVVYLGEPIHSGYVLIQRDYLVNVTSLEHGAVEARAP